MIDQNKLSVLFMLLLSVSAFLLLVIGASIYLYKRWREGKRRDKSTDESSVHVANHLVKFSSKAMKSATRDFQIRLGRGGSISFLHPTNTWLPGQRLHVHKMMASTNSTTSLSQGKFILSLSPKGIEVFLNMSTVKRFQTIPYRNYFLNMSSALLNKSAILVFNKSGSHITYDVAPRSKFHYMRLEPNGHLNIYQLDNGYSDNADRSYQNSF